MKNKNKVKEAFVLFSIKMGERLDIFYQKNIIQKERKIEACEMNKSMFQEMFYH